jgi:hypothetical protein
LDRIRSASTASLTDNARRALSFSAQLYDTPPPQHPISLHFIVAQMRTALTAAMGGPDGEKGPIAMTMAGFLSGAIGYGVSAPLWMFKTLGQAAPELRVPRPSVVELWSEGGIKRLYRGATPLVVRGACLSAGNMVGYDGTKTVAKGYGVADDPKLHIVASVVSAATATALAAPADVTMAYVHTARQRGQPFNGVIRCFTALVRDKGARALFRGYPVFFARMAPAFAVNLTLYEQARQLLGLGYLD